MMEFMCRHQIEDVQHEVAYEALMTAVVCRLRLQGLLRMKAKLMGHTQLSPPRKARQRLCKSRRKHAMAQQAPSQAAAKCTSGRTDGVATAKEQDLGS